MGVEILEPARAPRRLTLFAQSVLLTHHMVGDVVGFLNIEYP